MINLTTVYHPSMTLLARVIPKFKVRSKTCGWENNGSSVRLLCGLTGISCYVGVGSNINRYYVLSMDLLINQPFT